MAACDDSIDSQQFARIKAQLLQGATRLEARAHNAKQPDVPSAPPDRADIASSNHPQYLPNNDTAQNTKASPDRRRYIKKTEGALPRLNGATSAPNMAVVLDEMALQTRANRIRPSSFQPLPSLFDGGDTQPMESQIYKDHIGLVHSHIDGNGALDTPADHTEDGGTAPRTCTEGDTGHIDIVQHWQEGPHQDHPVSIDSESDEEIDKSPLSQAYTSSAVRSLPPKTPMVTAGSKRNRAGEVISSSHTKTPGSGLSNLFGNGNAAPGLSLTQLFNATQMPSSPLIDAPRSDPVFQRPSPNFANLRNSSPVITMSSPVVTMHNGRGREATEPRDTYTSMKESQERRLRRLQQEEEERRRLHSRSSDDHDVEDFEEDAEDEDSAQRRMERKRQQARIDGEAMQAWQRVTAPQRHNARPSHPKSAGMSSHGALKTPVQFTRIRREIVDISDDTHIGSDNDSVDEYDELAQSVRPSQGRYQSPDLDEKDDRSQADSVDANAPHVVEADGAAFDQREPLSDAGGPQVRGSAPEQDFAAPTQASNGFAIADSQPLSEADDSVPPLPRPPVGSSLPSIVTSSRSAALSAQNRERIANAELLVVDDSSLPLPPVASRTGTDQEDERVPSSPPIVPQSDEKYGRLDRFTPPNRETLSHKRKRSLDYADPQDAVSGIADKVSVTDNSHTAAEVALSGRSEQASGTMSRPLQPNSTIPETDPAEVERSPTKTGHYTQANSARQTMASIDQVSTSYATDKTGLQQTNNTDPFETARTHLTATPEQKRLSQRSSRPTSESPRKTDHIRSLMDIAADPTPPHAFGDIDMDFSIMTSEDADFINAMSSPVGPAKKRSKTYGAKAARVSPQKKSALTLHFAEDNAMDSVDTVPQPFEDSTKKNIAPRQLTPVSNEAPNPTPESVRKREEAGAKAASYARQTMTNKAKKTKARIMIRPGKLSRPAVKASAREAAQASKPVSAQTSLPLSRAQEIAETPQSKGSDTPSTAKSDTGQFANPLNTRKAQRMLAGKELDSSDRIEEHPIECPRRVFALFRTQYGGSGKAYFTATCLGSSTVDNLRYRIRFDDGTITMVEAQYVRKLELRIGDLVKVDVNKMRTKTYYVCGLKDKIDANSGEAFPKSDIRGYLEAVLVQKQRESLAPEDACAENTIDVPVTNIYLTENLWSRPSDRTYTHVNAPTDPIARLQTPSHDGSAPVTPLSRSRHRKPFNVGASRLRDESVASSMHAEGIFYGMVFAVTYVSNEDEKNRVMQAITSNGGRILEQGFHEMFHTPEMYGAASPSNKHSPATRKDNVEGKDQTLRLTDSARDYGFVALIADKHSRRAKYMQALALNLPCLSGLWVLHSVTAGKPIPWSKYLLPAGESTFLGGTVRSRTMTVYKPTETRLADVIEAREKMLSGGQMVFFVGNDKTWKRKKAHTFLTSALGASRVRRVDSIEAAKVLLADEKEDEAWLWVYVDGPVTEAAKILFGSGEDGVKRTGGAKVGKKRKRGSDGSEIEGEKLIAGSGRVKVVGDEFVIQSLILGELALHQV
ncbi:radiation sensitive protein rad9 [Elasticomyces elasticus]|nr:radiation sensitive protein rad9 [Elasticomyces elasticus]